MITRWLTRLFPPTKGHIKDLAPVLEFQSRLARKDNHFNPNLVFGKIGEVKEKKIIYLPGRVF
jgi:hypothetical protein